MPKCSVKSCHNNTAKVLKAHGISYFGFPKNEILREKWRKIIAQERGDEYFKPKASCVVCSAHFLDCDMYYTKKGYRKITKNAYPKIGVPEYKMVKNANMLSTTKAISEASKPSQVGPEVIKTEPIDTGDISPTSSLESIFISPETAYYKNRLVNCQRKLDLKIKEVCALKKKNKRLIQKITSLKAIVQILKKKIHN